MHLGLGNVVLGNRNRKVSRFLDAGALQRGDFHDLAAHHLFQLLNVNLIPIFLDDVRHVNSHDNRDAQLQKLRAQIEVTFQVGTVNDIKNYVGPVLKQVFLATTSSRV